MKESIIFIVRAAIFATCCYTLYQVFPIVLKQLQGASVCPRLGFVPACYVVFAGYLAMAFSVTMNPRKTAGLFFTGWIPVFLLASAEIALDLMGRSNCSATSFGIPLCYFSFVVALGLLMAYLFTRGKSIFRL